MAVYMPDSEIDAALDLQEGDAVHVCSAQPTTYTEAATTYQLATQAVDAGAHAKANGDSSGRKLTTTPNAGTTIDNSGTATHVAVTNSTTLKRVHTCTSQALTAAGTVDIGAFAYEIGDLA